MRITKRTGLGLGLGSVVLLTGGALAVVAIRPPTVLVVRPQERLVAEVLVAAGEVRGEQESNIGASVSGRVAVLAVRAGDRVQAGQVLARIEDQTLAVEYRRATEALRTAEGGVAQARSAVQSARTQLRIAQRKPLTTEVDRLQAETRQAVAVAQARLAVARQRLAELEGGATPEQRDQLAAQVTQAAVSLKRAERERDRKRRLLQESAIARVDVDEAETAVETAQSGLENLQARQRELLAGARTEQRAQARDEVRVAEATLRGAREAGQAQVASLLAQPRAEDVSLAQARLDEAQRAEEVAQSRVREARLAQELALRRLEEARVTAPFAGTVTSILTEVGGLTGAGQPLVKLVRTGKLELRVRLDEANLGRLQRGQRATITSDAFPGKSLMARVKTLGAEVNTAKGQVEVTLVPENPSAWLRPGQTVTVRLTVSSQSRSWLIPIALVKTAGNIPQVLAVEDGRVVTKSIEVGGVGREGVVVTSGLSEQSLLLQDSSAASPGQRVVVAPGETRQKVGH